MKENVKDITIWLKLLRSISIRKKLILFLSIGAASMLALYGGMSVVAQKTMLKNSADSMINLSAQLMNNLDYKVRGVESASYQIKDTLRQVGLYQFDNRGDRYTYKELNQLFQDSILASNELYPNVETALFENTEQIAYHYQWNGASLDQPEQGIPNRLKQLVSTANPVKWLQDNGKEILIRQLVDEKSLKTKGYLMLTMRSDFFDFIEVENRVLSNENMMILDRLHQVQKNTSFRESDPQIQNLIQQKDMGNSTSGMMQYEKEKYLVFKTDSLKTGWRTLILVPVAKILEQQRSFFNISFLMVCATLGILFLISHVIIKSVTRNIQILRTGMDQFEQDGKSLCIKPYNYDEVGLLIGRFNYMTRRIQDLNEHVMRERRNKESAEFQAMQAKINPHFLYNTLGSIKWIAHREKQAYMEKMLSSLIHLLRFSVKKTDTFLLVKEELDYVKNYLELQRMRFGDAYVVRYEVEQEAEEARMLGFLLQPIVENALYHGISMEEENGEIVISARIEQNWLVLQVKDNGKGMTPEEIQKMMTAQKEYNGFTSIGVSLIATRLRAFYPERHQFVIRSQNGCGTEVMIEIPYESREERCEECHSLLSDIETD